MRMQNFSLPCSHKAYPRRNPNNLLGSVYPHPQGQALNPPRAVFTYSKGSVYLTIRKGAEPTGFMPESTARIEPAPAYVAGGALGAITIIIDYHALAKTPMPAAMPMAKASPIAPNVPMRRPFRRKLRQSLPVWDRRRDGTNFRLRNSVT